MVRRFVLSGAGSGGSKLRTFPCGGNAQLLLAGARARPHQRRQRLHCALKSIRHGGQDERVSTTHDDRHDAIVPACLRCGACCFSQLPNYVQVTGADHARLGAQLNVEELTHFDGNRCYMNMRDGHCAALTIDLVTQQFVCSVYEIRPSTCRDLERGSTACQAEFHEKNARPAVLLNALLTRR